MEIFNNILIYFVIVPLLTLGGLAICRNSGIKAIRTVAVIGASALMVLAAILVKMFLAARGAGDTSEMILRTDVMWYAPFNVKLALGVDGVSVVMILLSAFIVFAGVFASWKMNPLPKQYFMWFFLLSTGVFGFFISIDLFTMFMFYEVALIPMYLLIGVWGSGNKNYSAMKLTLMLMGGSAFLMLGLIGIYFHSSTDSNSLTMNILEIAKNNAIPHNWQYVLFPLLQHRLWCLECLCADRPQVHQRLFVGEPLRYGAVCHPHVQHHSDDRCCAADALARSDDGLVLCPHRYDLWPHPHA